MNRKSGTRYCGVDKYCTATVLPEISTKTTFCATFATDVTFTRYRAHVISSSTEYVLAGNSPS